MSSYLNKWINSKRNVLYRMKHESQGYFRTVLKDNIIIFFFKEDIILFGKNYRRHDISHQIYCPNSENMTVNE